MTDEELDEVFASLATILTGMGMSWIVDQVNEEIQVGRIVIRRFHRGQEEVGILGLETRTTGKTAIGAQLYNADERVQLLISALRVALRDSANLEEAVGQFFSDDPAGPSSGIVISVPDGDISGSEMTIAGGNNPAAAAAQRTLPLLDRLTERIAQS